MLFKEKDFIVVKEIISKEICKLIAIQIKLSEVKREYENKETNEIISSCSYGSLISETLLIFLKKKIENFVNEKLLPSHSYSNIYYENTEIDKHVKGPSSEFSGCLCICIDEKPWNYCIKDKLGNDLNIELFPGDLIIYKGMKIETWREKYKNKQQIEIMLFYVNENGIYKNYIFDNRDILAINK
jgi:hypothetical protein